MLTEKKVEAGIVGREKPKHKGRPGSQSLIWFVSEGWRHLPEGKKSHQRLRR